MKKNQFLKILHVCVYNKYTYRFSSYNGYVNILISNKLVKNEQYKIIIIILTIYKISELKNELRLSKKSNFKISIK